MYQFQLSSQSHYRCKIWDILYSKDNSWFKNCVLNRIQTTVDTFSILGLTITNVFSDGSNDLYVTSYLCNRQQHLSRYLVLALNRAISHKQTSQWDSTSDQVLFFSLLLSFPLRYRSACLAASSALARLVVSGMDWHHKQSKPISALYYSTTRSVWICDVIVRLKKKGVEFHSDGQQISLKLAWEKLWFNWILNNITTKCRVDKGWWSNV